MNSGVPGHVLIILPLLRARFGSAPVLHLHLKKLLVLALVDGGKREQMGPLSGAKVKVIALSSGDRKFDCRIML